MTARRIEALAARVLSFVGIVGTLCQSPVALARSESLPSRASVIQVDDVALSLPPVWRYQRQDGGSSLLLDPPTQQLSPQARAGQKPLLRVEVSRDPQPIDEQQRNTFKQQLAAELLPASGSGTIETLDERLLTIAGGTQAILLSLSFQRDGQEYRQVNLFVSGAHRAVRWSYTDRGEGFLLHEALFLQAWESMIATQLAGKAPKRHRPLELTGLGVIGLLLLSLIIRGILRFQTFRFLRAAEYDIFPEDEPEVQAQRRWRQAQAMLRNNPEIWALETMIAPAATHAACPPSTSSRPA